MSDKSQTQPANLWSQDGANNWWRYLIPRVDKPVPPEREAAPKETFCGFCGSPAAELNTFGVCRSCEELI
jgi:hypothetical protein